MNDIYPRGPLSVPPNFTTPTTRYKCHAWLALSALVAFLALYFVLAGWFAFKAYWMFTAAAVNGINPIFAIALGSGAAFLAVFMFKALFFVKYSGAVTELEVKPVQQPRLFNFLNQLADEAKAPRPHRVFISARVNAAVFYDLSIINLFFPSRKNLEIGLGLVNVLDLSQFKAVLAHEFGHFGQRSMAVGRWVYIAQQIATHIVTKRDALDAFLLRLSRIDMRLAWIGWLLRLIVWSIRCLLEQLFRAVMIVQRALSREMEMQADLVSVSLAGSNALIDALHIVQGADESWDRAIAFANGECKKGRLTVDLFAVQARVIEHLRSLFADESFARTPKHGGRDDERVFRPEFAQPPRMWMTHPHNHDREENAKRTFLHAPRDDRRSAWELFDAPDALRREVTLFMVEQAQAKEVPIEESLRELDAQFAIESLRQCYRGLYLGRSPVRELPDAMDYFSADMVGSIAELESLYPDSLCHDLEQLKNLHGEIRMLESVRDGRMIAVGGVTHYRDRDVQRRELPAAIAATKHEAAQIDSRIVQHDKRCRSVHRAAAARLGNGWDSYHAGLLHALHFAGHCGADLRDAQHFLSNEYAVVTASGKVNAAKLARLLMATGVLYRALAKIYSDRNKVLLDSSLLARLETKSFAALLEEFTLPRPDKENIGKWLNAIDSWVNTTCAVLNNLYQSALELLLETEAQIAQASHEQIILDVAPTATRVPTDYATLTPGAERKLDSKLGWWDRFQAADGIVPAIARVVAAAGVVFAVVGFGARAGNVTLLLHNGLATTVKVKVADKVESVPAYGTTRVELPIAPVRIETRSAEGELIEAFDKKVDVPFSTLVYNIAGAAPLVEWTAVYGSGSAPPDRQLGAPRWSTTHADVLFADPPQSINTNGGGGTRTVLADVGNVTAQSALSLLTDAHQRSTVVLAHARWDRSDSPNFYSWLNAVVTNPVLSRILSTRLSHAPHDIALLRAEQDLSGDHHAEVCQRDIQIASAAPGDPGLQYLAVRCQPDGPAKDRRFVEGHQHWPHDPWWAYAAGYVFADAGQWQKADDALADALASTALREPAAIKLTRVRRIMHPNDPKALTDLDKGSARLQWLLKSETDGAYAQLQKANFSKALEVTKNEADENRRMLRLVAASDGASKALVQQALAMPWNQGLDAGTIGAVLGLALRERTDWSAIKPELDNYLGKDAAAFRKFADAVAHGNKQANFAVGDMIGPNARGQAYVLGIVAFGKNAPTLWRNNAHALLFAPERPYFK